MPNRRSPGRLLVGALLALVTVAAAVVVVLVSRPDPADHFVTRSEAGFEVDGEPFRFVGFNLYDAAATDRYSCRPETRLDDAGLEAAMRSISAAGGTVVRFWAFQTYTAGGTDYSGVDRVLRAARAHGLRVMPVLEDGPGHCSNGPAATPLAEVGDGTWYSSGYREPLGDAAVPYRDYVADIATHYRDEPAILGWSMVNEAETTQRDAEGRSVLVAFARDVAEVLHRAAPDHLVTLGTQSNGAPGASGGDFAAVYGLPGLDFTEVHDWGSWGSDTEAMPGADDDGLPTLEECQAADAQIACSFVIARALDKPVVVGEAGIGAEDAPARRRRADLLQAKIDAAFAAGASGYLVWQLNAADTDGYGVVIGSDDPTFEVLRTAAEKWSTG